MARIRTIKPDFWEDESVAALSPLARLLFIGSWNLADDEGLLRWTADYLNASLFMYDGLSVAKVKKLMDEVEANGSVFVYSGGKARQTLAYVVNFRKHQRINRPQPSRLPPPSIQNPATMAMYHRRDGGVCHICHGPINETKVAYLDEYDPVELAQKGSKDDNCSPDHLIPRAHGGTDYPSNIAACHIRCNKSRGARPVPDSSRHSVNDSVNEDVNDSPPEGKGVEGNGEPTSSQQLKSLPRPLDDDERASQALNLLVKADYRAARAKGFQIRVPAKWQLSARETRILIGDLDALGRLAECLPDASAEELVRLLEEDPDAPRNRELCGKCENGLVYDAEADLARPCSCQVAA